MDNPADGEHADDTDCLLCGGPTSGRISGLHDVRFGIAGTYTIRACIACGLEQTAPRPSRRDLLALYEAYYNFEHVNTGRYERTRAAIIRSGVYRLWIRMDGDISFVLAAGDGRRLLDVGCNQGRNLKLFAESGFDCRGLETNPSAASTARANGFTVYQQELQDLEEEAFDVIVLSNVLEHAEDPRRMLRSARRLLAPDGELWISCPNSESFARRLFGTCWINWHVPFHLSHFSSTGLDRLLAEEGFRVTTLRTVSPALWIAQSVVARRYAVPGRPTVKLRSPVVLAGLLVAVRLVGFPILRFQDRRLQGDCLLVTAGVDHASPYAARRGM